MTSLNPSSNMQLPGSLCSLACSFNWLVLFVSLSTRWQHDYSHFVSLRVTQPFSDYLTAILYIPKKKQAQCTPTVFKLKIFPIERYCTCVHGVCFLPLSIPPPSLSLSLSLPICICMSMFKYHLYT